jgi:hypothetical protein
MYKPKQELRSRVDRNFATHEPIDAPSVHQPERLQGIRDGLRRESLNLLESCPESRELSIALTKLEEARFWAEQAITCNERLKDMPQLEEGAEVGDAGDPEAPEVVAEVAHAQEAEAAPKPNKRR